MKNLRNRSLLPAFKQSPLPGPGRTPPGKNADSVRAWLGSAMVLMLSLWQVQPAQAGLVYFYPTSSTVAYHTNWSSSPTSFIASLPPDAGDTARFYGGVGTVTSTAVSFFPFTSTTNETMEVGEMSVELILADVTYSLSGPNLASGFLRVGTNSVYTESDAAGELLLSGGGTFNAIDVEIATSLDGSITVTDSTSLHVSNEITVGSSADVNSDGLLSINTGGDVTSNTGVIGKNGADSQGWVVVNGTGSIWDVATTLGVGGGASNGGTGLLTVLANGEVAVGTTLTVWDSGTVALADGTITATDLVIKAGGEVNTAEVTRVGDTSTSGGLNLANSISVDGGTVDGALHIDNTLIVGNTANGTLSITNGGIVGATIARIGNGSGFTGAVTVDGGDSIFSVTNGNMSLGRKSGSTGTLAVTNGGIVTTSGSLNVGGISSESRGTGMLTIESNGDVAIDTTLNVWDSGTVTLTDGRLRADDIAIATGGTVTSSKTVRVGDDLFTNNPEGLNVLNTLDVDGDEALLDATGQTISVGRTANGVLNVTDGGRVVGKNARVGEDTSLNIGTINVDGLGSTFEVSGNINLGYDTSSRGVLSLTDSGSATANGLYVGGRASGSQDSGGGVYIDTNGVLNVATEIVVYDGSTFEVLDGTITATDLMIETGGVVSVAEITRVGDTSTSDGLNLSNSISVAGGDALLDIDNILQLGNTADGTLSISDGAVVTATIARIGNASGFTGAVTVDGSGSSFAITNGNMSLGSTVGSMGTLAVTNEGIVTTSDSLNVGGISSVSRGTGVLTVDSNAFVSVGTDMNVWDGGTVNHSGGTITADTLVINAGGTVNSSIDSFRIGESTVVTSNGFNVLNSVTVSGADATLNFDGAEIFLARSDIGTLDVNSGGTVEFTEMQIGGGSGGGGSGTLNLDDASSQVNGTGVVNVGNAIIGTGVINISNGTFSAASMYVGGQSSASFGKGELNVSGGTLDLSGGELKIWDDGTVNHSGGTITADTLQIETGGMVNSTEDFFRIGDSSVVTNDGFNIANFVAVNGSGAILSAASMYVGGTELGSFGAGELSTSTSGGTLDISSGELKIWDAGTVNYRGGAITADTLVIEAGGTVNASINSFRIGDSTATAVTSNGFNVLNSVTVSGANATLDFDGNAIVLGRTDIGTLNVNSGGRFEFTKMNIGGDTGSGILNLDDASSKIIGTGDVNVGKAFSGTGVINISNGTFSAASMYVGGTELDSFGTGELNVSGGTLNLSGGELKIWDAGTVNHNGGTINADTLAINANGTVNLAGGTVTAANLDNLGTVAVAAHSTVNAQVSNTAGGRFEVSNNAVLILTGDVTHNGDAIDVAAGSTVVFRGAVDGASDFTGTGSHIFGGSFAPGNSPGLVNIAGDVEFGASHTLTMELAGLTPGSEYDVLSIDGTATLDGWLDVDLLSGFIPSLGDSFDLLTAATLFGTFDSLLLPELVDLQWELQYLLDPTGLDTVRLSAVSAVPVPSAVWLFGSGLVTLLGFGRRRRTTTVPMQSSQDGSGAVRAAVAVKRPSHDMSVGGVSFYLLSGAIVTAALFFCASPVQAQGSSIQRLYAPPIATGFFNGATNWDGGVVPDANDDAFFFDGVGPLDAYTVLFTTPVTNSRAIVGGTTVFFALSGQTYTLTGETDNGIGLIVGASGHGSNDSSFLTLLNGTVNANSTVLGRSSDYTGTLTVSTGATLENDESLWVGLGSNGNLFIEDGGQVSAADVVIGNDSGVTGTVAITDEGSQLIASTSLIVGSAGSGSMTLASGGDVTSASGAIATGANSISTVTVEGANSIWSLDNLAVGGSLSSAGGMGTLTVNAGTVNAADTITVWDNGTIDTTGGGKVLTDALTVYGLLSSSSGYLGREPHASIDGSVFANTVVVEGSGALWETSQNVIVGYNDTAELTISDTAIVEIGSQVIIGFQTYGLGGAGTVLVEDNAVLDIEGQLTVGFEGDAILNINSGGQVSSDSGNIAATVGSTGAVTVGNRVANSAWDINGSLYVGGAASASGGTGTLTVDGGGQLDVGDLLKVWGGGTVNSEEFSLINAASLEIAGGSVTTAGEVAVGALSVASGINVANTLTIASPGTLEVAGALTVDEGGTLNYGGGTVTAETLAITDGTANLTSAALIVGDVDTNASDFIVRNAVTVSGSNALLNLDYNSNTIIGNTADGSITIDSGGSAQLEGFLNLGAGAGVTGTLTVDGFNGDGTTNSAFNTINNSVVQLGIVSGSTGIINVSDGGSLNAGGLYLGGGSSGNVAGGTGHLTISDVFSQVDVSNQLTVWDGGVLDHNGGTIDAANLAIEAGGTINSTAAWVRIGSVGDLNGLNTAGSVTVNGSNARLNVTGNGLVVAQESTADLTVSNGGLVDTTRLILARQNSATGTLTLDAATVTTSGRTEVGFGVDATGILNVNNGGFLDTTALYVGGRSSQGAGAGTVNVSGGQVDVSGELKIWADGTLNLDSDGVINAASFDDTLFGGVFNFDDGTLNINGGTYDVGTNSLRVEGGSDAGERAVLGFNGGTHSYTRLVIADSNAGTLNLNNGAQLTTTSTTGKSRIGNSSGATGSVVVSGAGSSWTSNDSVIFVGVDGAGTLVVENGGVVTANVGMVTAGASAGSTGDIDVDGTGSVLTVNGSMSLGHDTLVSTGSGNLTVSNDGAVDIMDTLWVGTTSAVDTGAGAGEGTLSTDVLNLFGTATTNEVYIGGAPTGGLAAGDVAVLTSATLDGAAASWDALDFLIGNTANGSLTISDGAQITNSRGVTSVGRNSGFTGSLTVTGANSKLTGSLVVGESGNGSLLIDQGATVVTSSFANIGQQAGSTGDVTVRNGSTWDLASIGVGLRLGDAGDGRLTIESGGIVEADSVQIGFTSSGTGSITINDGELDVANTINVWNGGTLTSSVAGSIVSAGTLAIESGGDVTSDSFVRVGTAEDSLEGINLTDALTLIDSGSSFLTSNGLIVGREQVGSMTIGDGATVTSGSSSIGALSDGNGSVTVTGTNSQWTTGVLVLGASGTGILEVSNGARLYTTFSFLGNTVSGSGNATIDGANSVWTNSDSLYIGGNNAGVSGTGTLNVNSGGAVDVTNTLQVWDTGTVNLAGGTVTAANLDNAGTVAVAANSTVNAQVSNTAGGRFEVSNNAVLILTGDVTHNGDAIDVAAGSTVVFQGAVDGASDFTGSGSHIFEGSFAPGNSPGQVNIAGDVEFGASHTLIMELAGLTPGSEYDVLSIDGTATLGGWLDVDLLSGFTPSLGDSFDLLTAATLFGTFDSLLLPELVDLQWELQYLLDPTGLDTVRLSAVSAVPVPPAVWLFGSGLIGMVAIGRRRRRADARGKGDEENTY